MPEHECNVGSRNDGANGRRHARRIRILPDVFALQKVELEATAKRQERYMSFKTAAILGVYNTPNGIDFYPSIKKGSPKHSKSHIDTLFSLFHKLPIYEPKAYTNMSQDYISQLKEMIERSTRAPISSVLKIDFRETTGTESNQRWVCTYYIGTERTFLSRSVGEFTKKKDAQQDAARTGLRVLQGRSRL